MTPRAGFTPREITQAREEREATALGAKARRELAVLRRIERLSRTEHQSFVRELLRGGGL